MPSFRPLGGRHAGPFRGGSHVSSGRGANSIDARCVENHSPSGEYESALHADVGNPQGFNPMHGRRTGIGRRHAGMARGSWSVWQKSAGGFGCPWGSSLRTPQRRLVRPCTRPRDRSGASKAHGPSRSRGGVFTHVSRPDRGKATWVAKRVGSSRGTRTSGLGVGRRASRGHRSVGVTGLPEMQAPVPEAGGRQRRGRGRRSPSKREAMA